MTTEAATPPSQTSDAIEREGFERWKSAWTETETLTPKQFVDRVRELINRYPVDGRPKVLHSLRQFLNFEENRLSLADFLPKTNPPADNGIEASESKNSPMPTTPANSDDALWALRAWGERYDHPELREHIGKWVAIYGFRVILSGDDMDEVTRQAVEICGVPESRITVDFWEE